MTLLLFISLICLYSVTGFPQHASLAGISRSEIEDILPTLHDAKAEPPPPPLTDTSAKLVNDVGHPWQPLQPGDIRGPCPGLNTLASHGWLPRSGITTPAQIVQASQEGFNMGNDLATFVTYATMLVDGNLVTNLLSIGEKTPNTGPDPPKPAIVGGLNTHAVFEGDTSLTRSDAYFGDNHSFNDTLFNQFEEFSNRYGGGYFDLPTATELRWQRVQQSIATNPEFSYNGLRYLTSYAESVFPATLFVDGRTSDPGLNMINARGFFQNSQMPKEFHRSNTSLTMPLVLSHIQTILKPHPILPGYNNGTENYVFDPTSADFTGTFCPFYINFVNKIVVPLYPNPKGVLRRALKQNLEYFYGPTKQFGCTQIFPYGDLDE